MTTQAELREKIANTIMRSYSALPPPSTWKDREKSSYALADACLALLPPAPAATVKPVEDFVTQYVRDMGDFGPCVDPPEGYEEYFVIDPKGLHESMMAAFVDNELCIVSAPPAPAVQIGINKRETPND